MKNKLYFAALYLNKSFKDFSRDKNINFNEIKGLFVNETRKVPGSKSKNLILLFFSSFFVRITGSIFLPGSPLICNSKFLTALSIKISYIYLDCIYNLYLNYEPTLLVLFNKKEGLKLRYTFSNNHIKDIIGSPSSILSYPWSCIFHIENNNYKLTGHVHGGGYGEFNSNILEEFEVRASDDYVCWGVGEYRPAVSSRYPYKHFKTDIVINRIVVPAFNFQRMTALQFQNETASSMVKDFYIKNLPNFIKKLDCNIFLKSHPNHSLDELPYEISAECTEDLESGDLILIGHPFSTIFYKCINELLPFIIVFDKCWFDSFSSSYKEILLCARNLGLMIYVDEVEILNKYANGDAKFEINKISLLRSKIYG